MRRERREITSRAEWLEWRRQDVTASRIAALFGEHPYLTIDQLALELRGHSQGDNPAMRRGRILEPAIAAAVMEENQGWKLIKANQYIRIPELRLGCTPDYWLRDDQVIQCKSVAPMQWQEWRGHPPLGYTLQTLTEAMICDSKRAVLAVMVTSPSLPVHLFDVPRHEKAEQRIVAAVREWWRRWDAGEIAAPALADALRRDLDDGSHVDLSTDNMLSGLLAERKELKDNIRDNEARLAIIDAEIKDKMGGARTGWLPGWLLEYPTIHRNEYTVAAKDYRRLNVKEE